MRPIDGDALEQFFLHEYHRLQEHLKSDEYDEEEKEYIRTLLPDVEWARKTVHHVTTINSEDLRPKGKWEDHSKKLDRGMNLYCSICHHKASEFVGGSEDWWEAQKPKYCPNCGCQMKEE